MRRARPISRFHTIVSRETALERFPPPGRGALPVAAGYPAPYRVGMANLGFHFLYAGLRSSPRLAVERFFSDTAPFTLETGAPLSSRAVLLFSVSYEEDYVNLVRILHEAGIPPLREERSSSPLVVVGGPAASANPAPLAAIADAIAVGEGEGVLEPIVRLLAEEGGGARRAALEGLAGIPSMIVPGLPGPGAPSKEPFGGPFPYSVVATPESVFPDTFLVESGRGCPGACAFCLATSLYRPFRFLRKDALEEILSRLAAPVRRVGLVSPAVAANPEFVPIVRMLASRGLGVAMSSLRAEDLDEEKARLIGSVGTASVSLAPESGSERLRYRLGKRVPNELYFNAAARLSEAGVRQFTLYLLIGFPGEDAETVAATKGFLEGFRKAIGGRSFSVHVNVLVPKAWTPLQFHPMPDERSLESLQNAMTRTIEGAGLRARTKSVRSAVRQALFSLGDERIGRAAVLHVAAGLAWKKALAASGADTEFIRARKGPETPFPWDAIPGPVRRGVLWKRFEAISAGGRNGEP
ncbi:MAG: radical SAM protein [Candidatus Latescibacterota bacterium]|nr:MAG: radical SAM protein [Candidatus Latescibacterota bacterium]